MAVSVSIVDVAAYILARESTMVTLKLHNSSGQALDSTRRTALR